MLELIKGYAARGWRVIQIHGVTADGACTCFRGSSCQSAGKHPVTEDWSKSPIPDALVPTVFGPDGRQWNVGLLTGEPSGFWVLDIDPDHQGAERLAELVAVHGALPLTHMVQTGSGGTHYYFRMPGDRPVTNSKGQIPRGIDVRGTGGQVVAPPSVSGRGPYSELVVGVPPAEAPAWLYGLMSPRQPTPTDRGTLVLPAGAAQADLTQLAPAELARVAGYARSAVIGEVARMRAAQQGERNIVAFNTGCNLAELLNASWSQLDANAAVSAWSDAVRSTGLLEDELSQVWESARRKVGLTARAYPPLGGTAVAGALPPFPGGQAGPSGSDWTGTMAGPRPLPDLPAPEPRRSLRDQLQTLIEAEAQPPPEWLVSGWLTTDASSWLIGESGIGKSFAAVSLAACVAVGVPWFGRSVKPGRVLYLAAEGSRGLAKRFTAWRQEHEQMWAGMPGLDILPVPVQASAAEWWELCQLVTEERYALVVLDTQARITVGMEENSNTDMGQFVERIEALRRAAGAAVLVVHHVGKGRLDARGAGAIKAAAQTEITTTRDQGGRIQLRVTKQKDAEEPVPLDLMLRRPREVPGVLVDPGGSVVLVEWSAARTELTEDLEHGAAVNLLAAIGASTFAEGIGGTKADFRGIWRDRNQGRPRADAFFRAFNTLLDLGILRPVIGRTGSFKWVPADGRESDGPLVEVVINTQTGEKRQLRGVQET